MQCKQTLSRSRTHEWAARVVRVEAARERAARVVRVRRYTVNVPYGFGTFQMHHKSCIGYFSPQMREMNQTLGRGAVPSPVGVLVGVGLS